MARQNFINKKVIVYLVIAAILVAGIVLLVGYLTPKANLKAPYEYTYDLVLNETFLNTKDDGEDIITYLNSFISTNPSDASAPLYVSKFERNTEILRTLQDIDIILLNNLLFCTDNGGFVDLERGMESSKEKILKSAEECTNFVKTNILPLAKIFETDTYIMFNYIKNFAVLYDTFTENVVEFYSYAGKLYNSHVDLSYNVTSFTKLSVTIACDWAKEIILANKNPEFVDVPSMRTKLFAFIQTNTHQTFETYYLNKLNFDKIIDYVSNADYKSIISSLARNTYNELIDNTNNQENKNQLTWLKQNYFGLEVA